MMSIDPRAAARSAVAATPTRPASAVLFDAPEARLVVFRILPGQSVRPHRNASTVILEVLHGEGFVSGRDGERACTAGDMVTYDAEHV
jgi:quercetin dioxygenase-like cupin family protein